MDIIVWIVGGGCVVLLALVALPALFQSRRPVRFVELSNVKQLDLGNLLCANDYDDRLPTANKWMDEIRPYAKPESLYHVPPPEGVKAATPYEWVFRRSLACKVLSQPRNAESTALLFDSNFGFKNASFGLEALPDPPRYNGGDFVGFLDGHARWISKNDRPKLK